MGGPEETQRTILIETLTVAVPLWIDRLAAEPGRSRGDVMLSWAADASDAVSSRGDVLQYGGKRGEAASVFNALARGLAALAHCPGGVQFLGVLWCARHHPMGAGEPGFCVACGGEYPTGGVPAGMGPFRAAVRMVEHVIPQEGVL